MMARSSPLGHKLDHGPNHVVIVRAVPLKPDGRRPFPPFGGTLDAGPSIGQLAGMKKKKNGQPSRVPRNGDGRLTILYSTLVLRRTDRSARPGRALAPKGPCLRGMNIGRAGQ